MKILTTLKDRRILMSEEIEKEFAAVDKVKAAKIMQKIIIEEAANLKSKGKSDSDMVRTIQKMIEEEVQCF